MKKKNPKPKQTKTTKQNKQKHHKQKQTQSTNKYHHNCWQWAAGSHEASTSYFQKTQSHQWPLPLYRTNTTPGGQTCPSQAPFPPC